MNLQQFVLLEEFTENVLLLNDIVTHHKVGEDTPDNESKIDSEPPTDTNDTNNTALDLLIDDKEVNRPDSYTIFIDIIFIIDRLENCKVIALHIIKTHKQR